MTNKRQINTKGVSPAIKVLKEEKEGKAKKYMQSTFCTLRQRSVCSKADIKQSKWSFPPLWKSPTEEVFHLPRLESLACVQKQARKRSNQKEQETEQYAQRRRGYVV